MIFRAVSLLIIRFFIFFILTENCHDRQWCWRFDICKHYVVRQHSTDADDDDGEAGKLPVLFLVVLLKALTIE